MQIQTTKDYNQFKLILGNRALSKSNLKKITKSIARKNMLDVAPIIVNENFEIIDGQHRFQVAKENNFPIRYIVLSDGNLEDVHSLNNISRKWNSEDYIRSYATIGKPDYRKLLKFMQDNDVSMSMSLIFITGNSGGHEVNLVKRGKFHATDGQFNQGEERLSVFNTILSYYEGSSVRLEYLARAVNMLINAGFSQVLIDALSTRDIKFKHQPSVVEYLREFETILNWKKRENHMIRIF